MSFFRAALLPTSSRLPPVSIRQTRTIFSHASIRPCKPTLATRGSTARIASCFVRGAVKPRFQRVRWNSSRPSPDPTPKLGSPPAQPPTLSQRLKALSKEYGWTALGVYLGLSALDFPFCFLAVRWLGADRIGQWEHAAVESVRSLVHSVFPDLMQRKEAPAIEAEEPAETTDASDGRDSASMPATLLASRPNLSFLLIAHRYLDPACFGLCSTQVVDRLPGSANSSGTAQGSQDVTRLGISGWKTKPQKLMAIGFHFPSCIKIFASIPTHNHRGQISAAMSTSRVGSNVK
jgi:hypothetical protein